MATYPNATQNDRDICGSTLAVGLLRAELNAETQGVKTLYTSSTWMTCEPSLHTAMYELEVNTTGRVENYVRKSNFSTDIPITNEHRTIPSILSSLFVAFDSPFDNDVYAPYWQATTFRDNWPGFLIKALTDSTIYIDPSLPAPGFEEIAPFVVDLLTRLFPIILSLRPTAFVPAVPGTIIEGTMMVPCNRVFMSESMFIVAVILLLSNIAVALAYYRYRPKPIPTGVTETIAGVLALFDGSGLVEEQVSGKPWPKDWTFGYGRFNGVDDGKPRNGIERRPFVVPFEETKRK